MRYIASLRRFCLLVPLISVVPFGPPALPSNGQGGAAQVCNILGLPHSNLLSGAGETALRRRCPYGPGRERGARQGAVQARSSEPVGERSLPGGLQGVQGTLLAGISSGLATNVRVNNPAADTPDVTTQSEPSLAISGSVVLVAFNDSGEFPLSGDLTGYARSTDGGATFTDLGTFPGPPGGNHFGDPDVEVDSSGHFFVSTLAQDASGRSMIGVGKSTDGGLTFAPQVDASPGTSPLNFQDKPFMAVDRTGGPFDGHIYLSWTEFSATGTQILFSRSTDGATTFTPVPPLALSALNGLGGGVQGTFLVVAPDGTLYVFWTDFTGFPTVSIRFVRSTDGGASFGAPATVAAFTTGFDPAASFGCPIRALKEEVRILPLVAADADPTDPAGHRLAVAYFADPDGAGPDRADVFLIRTENGGLSWSAPLRLNDDATGNDQWFPFPVFAPDGTLGVMWYDRRLDARNIKIDVFMALSADGGASFGPNFRLTDRSFSVPRLNPNFDPIVADCYMGDYNHMTVDGSTFYAVWGDNRTGVNSPIFPGGRPDPDVRFGAIPVHSPILSPRVTVDDSGGNNSGTPDPGEIGIQLTIALRNAGTVTATGISTHLSSTAPGVSIIQPASTYPDIPPLGGIASNDVPFVFNVASMVASGSFLEFRLQVTTAQGDVELPFRLQAGQAGATVTVFFEDFEAGPPPDWTVTRITGASTWNLEQGCRSPEGGHSTPTSFRFGDPTQTGGPTPCDYDTGDRSDVVLESPPVDLRHIFEPVTLSFNYLLGTEGLSPFDRATLEISVDGGPFEPLVDNISGLVDPSAGWVPMSLDLSPYVGSRIRLHWRFDTVDESFNTFDGWYVDDVRVIGRQAAPAIVAAARPVGGAIVPMNRATLLVPWTLRAILAVLFCSGVLLALRRQLGQR